MSGLKAASFIGSTKKGFVLFALLAAMLLFVLVAMPAPASATQPETIKFDINMVYDVSKGDFIGNGTWTSEGVVESAGNGREHSNHVGLNEVGFVRNVHATGVLWDDNGTIEYKAHAINVDGFNPFTADGNWTITGGTGAYENLKGQGQGQGEIISSGYVDYPYFIVTYEFVGSAHFEPQ
jgi:hypothetical protein